MLSLFITIRALDIIDILLVAFVLYQLYRLVKGTGVISIVGGVAALYVLWLIVRLLNMELLSSILGQVLGVGVIALIVVFQPEIRKFLLLLGNRYMKNNLRSLDNLLRRRRSTQSTTVNVTAITQACINMSVTQTGALIAIARSSNLQEYAETGDIIDAQTSSRLLENLFFKNSPLHDGAVIIIGSRVHAARCVLPISENLELPPHYGMRHKSAIGLSEVSDALVVLVSEETGKISVAADGKIKYGLNPNKLADYLLARLDR